MIVSKMELLKQNNIDKEWSLTKKRDVGIQELQNLQRILQRSVGLFC